MKRFIFWLYEYSIEDMKFESYQKGLKDGYDHGSSTSKILVLHEVKMYINDLLRKDEENSKKSLEKENEVDD